MQIQKPHFVIALAICCGYVLQRALLIMSGQISLEEIQGQPQVQGTILGIDVSFSYLGMNMFWPFVIGLLISGYKLAPHQPGELTTAIRNLRHSQALEITLVRWFPLLVLSLHLLSLVEFMGSQVQVLLAPVEDYFGHQGRIEAPGILARVAAAMVLTITAASLIFAMFATFLPPKSPEAKASANVA
ncbi:hypothetical protein ATO7_08877 [Oceanococcus atlanticus]|uniref:Uncharacterized protein n=1 Tax=Oceanococcus atlanticus TaxID=1317117 RepID=A0A1Y1SDZ5_9GAMM|nr:hypothetical protein [Oceanococcus atlanticus]ORE87141.1 hypothetical protein ATO7_08877 [Oceanococcus atlanticus]